MKMKKLQLSAVFSVLYFTEALRAKLLEIQVNYIIYKGKGSVVP